MPCVFPLSLRTYDDTATGNKNSSVRNPRNDFKQADHDNNDPVQRCQNMPVTVACCGMFAISLMARSLLSCNDFIGIHESLLSDAVDGDPRHAQDTIGGSRRAPRNLRQASKRLTLCHGKGQSCQVHQSVRWCRFVNRTPLVLR